MILTIAIIIILDVAGYIIKCKISETFSTYHLRRIPFIWIFYAD
jgi:hypothetical protein